MRGSATFFVTMACLLAVSAEAASVTRGPYLQMGSNSRITIRWRTDVATDTRVIYGTTQGSLTLTASNASSVTEHEISITGLAADTTYYYAIGTAATVLVGNDADHFFVTSPAPGTAKATRIWVLGDCGTADANAAAVRDAYYSFTGSRHTDLWLMLGDNAYNTGTDAEFQSAVFDMYPAMLRKSVLWSVVGNHETNQSQTFSSSYPYFQSFTFPTNAEAGGLASGTEQYYSFDYGNIHFVCLDSMTSNRSAAGPMATWLTNDLSSNNKAWTIVLFHHPPYTKGSHNSDTESQLVEMRTNILPILESAGVDLVLCGHSHSYERSYLINGHYGLSTTLTSGMKKDGGSGRLEDAGAYKKATVGNGANEGAVYAVAGSSGKISGGNLNHPAMFISLNVLGSMVLDVSGNQLDAKFLDNAGAVRDYFTVVKGTSSDTQAPTAPSNLAMVSRTDTAITMSWIASTDDVGVTAYHIYRDGVDVGSTTATSFTDLALTNGTNYSYTVRAQDAAGNISAASNIMNTQLTFSSTPAVTHNPALVNQELTFSAPIGAVTSGAMWTWTFGDGGSIQTTDGSATHVFTSAGVFPVVITVSGAGQVISATLQIVVYDGSAASPEVDSDGDGVGDVFELLDGTDPLSAASVLKTPYAILKAGASLHFNATGKDGCSLSGIISGIPASFNPKGAKVSLNFSGAVVEFVLDTKGKGRAKTDQGALALKLRYGKKDPATKVAPFLGGDVPVKAKLIHGVFAASWTDEGAVDTTVKNAPLTMMIDINMAGRVYTATVSGLYTASQGRTGRCSYKK